MKWWLRAAVAVSVLSLALTGPALGNGAGQAQMAKVTVTLTDKKLGISTTNLEAGAATFLVVNRGSKRHSLAITGPGLKLAQTPKVAPGRSATLVVTLRKGAYMLSLSNPVGLGMSSKRWVEVMPATTVSSSGSSSVVQQPPENPSPVCGGLMP
jgi:hypothetical protein